MTETIEFVVQTCEDSGDPLKVVWYDAIPRPNIDEAREQAQRIIKRDPEANSVRIRRRVTRVTETTVEVVK